MSRPSMRRAAAENRASAPGDYQRMLVPIPAWIKMKDSANALTTATSMLSGLRRRCEIKTTTVSAGADSSLTTV